MAINKEELLHIFEQLPEQAQQSALDFLLYLSFRQDRPDWDQIIKMKPDDEPLSDEEQRQLNSNNGFVSWEEAMNELGLPTDTKS
jgi:hypothetical protein